MQDFIVTANTPNPRAAHAPAGFRTLAVLMLALYGLGLPTKASACATCGCSLSSDAAMGYSADPGWRVNLEYDFIDQDQLRSGAASISPQAAALPNNFGANQEIERQTINRYTTLGVAYSPSSNWNFNLMLPFVDRSHSTYGAAESDAINQANLSAASSDGLGDIKFLVDYQGLLPTHNWGLQFGVKLPTGHYGGENPVTGAVVGRDPVLFSSGPAAGSALDTSLNTGTGSTDLIVGSYYYQPVSQNFDAFVSGQFQSAVSEKLNQPNQDFRPGNVTTVSFGLRYEENPDFVPQVQVNMTHKVLTRAYSPTPSTPLATWSISARARPLLSSRVCTPTALYNSRSMSACKAPRSFRAGPPPSV